MRTSPKLPRGLTGLLARLLMLTVIFVMISEVLIYAPSIARFRKDYLDGRIAAAHLATLALEATPDNMVSEELKTELLDHAGALAIVIAKPHEVRRVLSADMPPNADAVYDLRAATFVGLIADAFMALGEADRARDLIAQLPKDFPASLRVQLGQYAPAEMTVLVYDGVTAREARLQRALLSNDMAALWGLIRENIQDDVALESAQVLLPQAEDSRQRSELASTFVAHRHFSDAIPLLQELANEPPAADSKRVVRRRLPSS